MIDGELNFITKLDRSGFDKGTKAIGNGLGSLKSSLKSLAKVAAAAFSVKLIKDYTLAAKEAYTAQEQAEVKLITIMRQRMNATDEVIDSIKELAAEQQKLGVIGDEVQLAGAQQIATFLNEAESIKTLLPAMNDLLAQQQGLNATSSDAVNIGNLMGTVLQGQTSALKRVGISFSDAEEQVLKYGTESERAAMLAQVITNNVGHMNEALAQTDAGKQKQLANTMSDVKEQFGQAVMQIESVFLPVLAKLVDGLSRVADMAVTASTAIRAAFGADTGNSAVKTTAAVAKNYESIADSAEDTEEAQEGTLASFDKVIKLEDAQSSSSDSTGILSGVTGSSISDTLKVSSWADELKKSIDKGDWSDVGSQLAKKVNKCIGRMDWSSTGKKIGKGITNAFSAAYAFLKETHWTELGENIAGFLNGIISETDFSLIGNTLGAKLNAGIGLALGFAKTFDWAGAGLGLADIINGWFTEVDWAQLGEAFGEYIKGLVEFGFNFVTNLDFVAMAKNFALAFNKSVKKIDFKKLGQTVSAAFKGVWDYIGTALKEIDWVQVGKSISEFINGIDWKGILRSLFGVIGGLIKAMPELLEGIIENLDFENAAGLFAILLAPKMASSLLKKFKTDSVVKGDLTKAGETIGTQVGGSTSTSFTSKFAAGLNAATSVIQAAIVGWGIGTMIYNAAKPAIDKITDDLVDAFHTDEYVASTEAKIVSDRKALIAELKQKGATWLDMSVAESERADEIIYRAGAIIGKAKEYSGVSVAEAYAAYQMLTTESEINSYLKKLSEERIKNADTSKILSSLSNLPSSNFTLPKLASGTVVPANYGEFSAILGDNRREPEVVSPISTMKQALSEALAEQGGKQPIVLNLTLDTRRGRKLLSQQVIDDINDIINSTGSVPINL